LGKARLPEPAEKSLAGIKTIEDRWVTSTGMQKILDSQLPDREPIKKDTDTPIGEYHFIKRENLWHSEPRVGIGIDRESRTTVNAQLYMATHTRMMDGVSLQVALDGYGGGFERTIQPLAGEHRMAEISANSGKKVELPEMRGSLEGGRYCVILLSPLVIDKIPGSEDKFDRLPGKVISACLGKPVVIGGWDSRRRTSIPLRQCIPASSVWFMQGDKNLNTADIVTRIGKATEWGFGQVLIGKW
jgi:CRISPR-associated protein Cmr3